MLENQNQDAIVHIFRNNGNPPPSSSVILEATNEEELNTWKTREFSLPPKVFLVYVFN